MAPLSTIPNWAREFEAWTDMNYILYQVRLANECSPLKWMSNKIKKKGRNVDRDMIRQYEWHFQDDRGMCKID